MPATGPWSWRANGDDPVLVSVLVRVLYLVLVVAVPGALFAGVYNQELLKVTVLVLVILLIVALRSWRAVMVGRVLRGPRSLLLASTAFVAALLVTSMLSPQPWVAFTGATGRGAGAITYVACLLLLHATFRDYANRSIGPLLATFVAAHVMVAGFALIQAYGLDPFNWAEQMVFGGFVHSTFGNPNFSSAFVAMTLPLVVWCQFHPSLHRVVRLACGAMTVASMAAITFLVSFQGEVVAWSAFAVPAVWVLQQRGRRQVEALALSIPIVVTVVFTPVLLAGSVPGYSASHQPVPVPFTGSGSLTILLLMVMMVGATSVVIHREGHLEAGGDAAAIRWPSWRKVLAVGTPVLVGAGLLVWPRVSEGAETGILGRREMWRIGVRIFTDNPIVGTGLETYISYYSPLRTVEEAVRSEAFGSDNVHSVPFGMFTSGGLLLGLSYLCLMTLVGYYGVRALRRASGTDQVMVGAVLTAWIGSQLQSMISIDVPGLVFIHWLLGGVLLARGVGGGLWERLLPFIPTRPSSDRMAGVPRGQRRSSPTWGVVAGLGISVIVLALLGPVTAPLRADVAYRDGVEASLTSDLKAAHEHLQEAASLQPRNGRYAEALGRLEARTGALDSARRHLERSAELQRGGAEAARFAGYINWQMGDIDTARHWYEAALTREPYGPFNLGRATAFYAAIGQPETILARLAHYENLGSDSLNEELAVLYEVLGHDKSALRLVGRLDQGSATVFTRSGGTWSQQATLTHSDAAVGDNFGRSVALSEDGNTVIVGANFDDVGDTADQGSATVFTRSGGTWSQQATLTQSDAAVGDNFGRSVALSEDGNTVIVGANFDDVGDNADQGSATVFTRSGGTWSQQATLTQSDGAVGDNFGWSVALSEDGNTVIVGADGDDVGLNADQGSATVFTRSGGTWSQQATLTQSDGVWRDNFGWSVGLSADGNTVIAGAPGPQSSDTTDQGSATVFTRSGSTWSQQATLTQSDGAVGDNFGRSVALSEDGNTVIAGANLDDVGDTADQGSATVFTRSGGTWSQQATLTQSDGVRSDNFGWSVGLSADGNTVIIAADGDDVGDTADQGSATVFTRSGGTWSQQATLTQSDGARSDNFGRSVGLSKDGNTVIVGAYTDDVDGN